ncbi:glycoside hydrolase family 125 protein [Butyrivibrio sp. MB2005]|uniref:glycoside hydrolase family 125 protein n=1 Tax=Butyrivibrio sp. MB2005 TaxID=1280678 RepID=UPI000404904A|nr:glycoside hydrolase family 125 protein [Butyrivibrio sp. MB2005]
MSFERDIVRENEIKESINRLSEELADRLKEKGASDKLVSTFKKCFVNTADTTMQCTNDGKVFLITGDIEAMWLRDSSAQVCHYLPFAGTDKTGAIGELVKGVIRKQFEQICIDPYANAFNKEPDGRCWAKDRTDDNPWDWERKYELDSICYPIRLLYMYVDATGDESVLDEEVRRGIGKILDTMETEQDHTNKSAYYFERDNCPESDTLPFEGKGNPVAATGMIWSGFRPSDDACKYGYLIPANLFAVEVLGYLEKLSQRIGDEEIGKRAKAIKEQVKEGIEKYGMTKDAEGNTIYAYETDGLGNVNFMDDANVPSLMSIPFLTSISGSDAVYKATRKAVLSSMNPYYYEGTAAKGIGSPHTPKDYIWHIALSMQGLTSDDKEERAELIEKLISTDAGTGYMHEGFHKDDPAKFTREWFAWSNSLFSLFVIDAYDLYC